MVPEECISYIGKYMTSMQYRVDSEMAIKECAVYLSTSCSIETDAWISDCSLLQEASIRVTLPSVLLLHFLLQVLITRSQYSMGEKLNLTSLEEWMKKAKASAMEHSLKLFNEIKGEGSRSSWCLRDGNISDRPPSTTSSLPAFTAGQPHTEVPPPTLVMLMGPDDELKGVQDYKAEARNQLVNEKGYRIWGILGNHFRSIEGLLKAKRIFKLPNPLYYIY
ncbi:hypothetical protein CDL15_Pgr011999 [Punica granatum]|uniref:Uncharacterized protein n=1 Tax=Punica granatum TaxID=22663 RepID=A0A218WDD6_PUNGR|nr:hypothetical protein CDL15_Pgr011999 [Punica granatum]PKI48787.1 hypothetical protein CRG98_030829 [Punica granatum]